MDLIQVCYVDGDSSSTAAGADAPALSSPGLTIQPVESVSAALDQLETGAIDCLLAEWIPSKPDRESLLAVCRQQNVAVVWLTDQPTAVFDTLDADGVEYISESDAAHGSLLTHRIQSAVTASRTHQEAGEQSLSGDLTNGELTNGDRAKPPSSAEIVDRSGAGILVFDAEGKITQLNPAAEAILELPAADAIGNSCEALDMRTPDDELMPMADRPVARVLESGEPIEKSVVSIPDGSCGRRWLSISASPLANGETINGVVVTLEDVSAEMELESTLQTVFDRMTDGFVAFDTDLRLTYFSKQAIDTDRYPGQEFLGSRLSELGDHLAQYEADLQEVLDTQEPKTVETYVREPTDEWIRARLYPSETGVSVFFREVTAEKQRERELEQYKTIVESVRDGVCILDSSFEFVFVNEAFCEQVGYEEAELLGENATLVTDPGDMDLAADGREQLFAGDSEAIILTGEITANGGNRVPVETWMTSIELVDGETGTVGVVRNLGFRKRTEAMFTALYDAAHELLAARSDQAIAEIATEAAVSVLGFEESVFLQYDDKHNEFQPLAYTPAAVETFPELLPIAAETNSIAGRAYFESELVATEDLSELPDVYDPETPYRRALFIPLDEHGVLFVGDTDPGSTTDQTLTVAELLGTTVTAAVDRLAADRASQAHRQTLAEQTAELEALSQTTELVKAFGEQLFSAQSREDVEAVVCSVLAGFEPYRLSWIGTSENREETITVRHSVGDDDGYLDWFEQQLAESVERVTEPTARAAATNAPVSIDRIADAWQTEPWRKEALSRGFQSVLSVPLRHNEISYGVLSVYADSQDAFDEYTKNVLGEFGRIIAYVIASTETKQGLLADRRTELELDITDDQDILHKLAGRLDTQLTFEGVVPQADSHALLFFSVSDRSQEAVEAAAAELCSVKGLRVVTEQHGTTLYETLVSGDVLAATIVDCGAIPTQIETDGDRQRAVVTLPQSTEVRTFTERLKGEYPSTTVVSRQSREGGLQTRETFQMQLRETLTERQAETLQAAYYARYFESPRGSTGTEVGNSLGISQPTFNYHLRAALRSVLTMLFEGGETLDR